MSGSRPSGYRSGRLSLFGAPENGLFLSASFRKRNGLQTRFPGVRLLPPAHNATRFSRGVQIGNFTAEQTSCSPPAARAGRSGPVRRRTSAAARACRCGPLGGAGHGVSPLGCNPSDSAVAVRLRPSPRPVAQRRRALASLSRGAQVDSCRSSGFDARRPLVQHVVIKADAADGLGHRIFTAEDRVRGSIPVRITMVVKRWRRRTRLKPEGPGSSPGATTITKTRTTSNGRTCVCHAHDAGSTPAVRSSAVVAQPAEAPG
jgi:hypothetical protein